MSWEKELAAAREAAAKAGEVALRYFRDGIVAEDKPDDSPVTLADRECERIIADLLSVRFPEDGILGEEGSRKSAVSGRRWIIDPIDGTKDFVRGIPTWAILIGLEVDGEVTTGVAHLPALGETYFAMRDGGAFLNGSTIRVSGVTSLSRAIVCMDCLNRISDHPIARGLVPWLSQFWAIRSLGGIMDAMLVASGRAEAWIEPTAKAWDLAPIQVIIEEAGGRFLNFNGDRSIYGGNCVVCTPEIEAELHKFLNF
jgi:histidinol phosphatase-like enzyme (inositol monophosphatase family)